jgi:hypothetical protein
MSANIPSLKNPLDADAQEALRLRRYLIHYFAGLFEQGRVRDAQRAVDRWRQRLPTHPHAEALRSVLRRAQDAVWKATGEGDLP